MLLQLITSTETYTCEKCHTKSNVKFGSGRFCSRACANSRIHTEETKSQISKSLFKEPLTFVCSVCEIIFASKHYSQPSNQQKTKYCSQKCKCAKNKKPTQTKSETKIDIIETKHKRQLDKVLYELMFDKVPTEKQLSAYLKNRKYAKKKHKQNRKLRTNLKRKRGGCCEKCEETDLRLLELAHYKRGTKRFKKWGSILSTKGILEENERGRFLCVWCHRLETADEYELERKTIKDYEYDTYLEKDTPGADKCNGLVCQGRYIHISNFRNMKRRHVCRQCKNYYVWKRSREYRQEIQTIKMNIGKCNQCNVSVTPNTTCCFDFDHIIHTEKSFAIATGVSETRPIELIKKEIEKCQLLCCKCHRLKTLEEQNCVNVNLS